MSAETRLYEFIASRRYLESANHPLNDYVVRIRQAIKDPRLDDVDDLLERLDKELQSEEETLLRAFKLFDPKRQEKLGKAELKNMNRYLGFPAEDRDLDQLMVMIDTDRSNTISFDEFQEYVGKMGGSQKLFEERQKRIKEKLGYDVDGTAEHSELEASQLELAGIDKEAQAYWKMVVHPSEFHEAAKMESCQCKAVSHIRRLAKRNHQEALPKLQQTVARLGFKEDDLWLTLAWIRELAPVIIHVDLDKMLTFLEKDTNYRNQFETKTSGGLLKPATREKWERDLFGGTYDGAKGFDRPKYGVQNVMNDPRGVVKCKQYGDSYLVLKDCRLRCTFSPEDSANLKADKLAVLDFSGHVLALYDDTELKETIRVATQTDAALLGDSEKVGHMKYKEAQIHGPVDFRRHVERLVAHERHRSAGDRLKAMCKSQRMCTESIGHLGGKERGRSRCQM